MLTLGCVLRCRMCHLWKNDEAGLKRPGLQEWKRFISSIAKPRDSEFTVIFGGGEPMLFADILLELISFCRERGFRTSLATSGYFIDEAMAGRLADSGLDYIALTLYSPDEKTHNFLRGMPDSYDKLIRAIGYLAAHRASLEIAIDTVIMAPNLGEILRLADWVKGDGRISSVFFQSVVQPFHTPALEEWYKSGEYQFLWPKDAARVDLVIDGLIERKERLKEGRGRINNPVSQLKLFKEYFRDPRKFIKHYSCNVINDNAFTVSPDGGVNLCPYMKPIGNIRGGSLRDIWHSREALARRDDIACCKKNCHHIINCWYEEEKAVCA